MSESRTPNEEQDVGGDIVETMPPMLQVDTLLNGTRVAFTVGVSLTSGLDNNPIDIELGERATVKHISHIGSPQIVLEFDDGRSITLPRNLRLPINYIN